MEEKRRSRAVLDCNEHRHEMELEWQMSRHRVAGNSPEILCNDKKPLMSYLRPSKGIL
jgi:hypothetical protein